MGIFLLMLLMIYAFYNDIARFLKNRLGDEVIGIDTASGAASVALVENGLLLSEKTDLRCESARDAIRRGGKSNRAETLLPLIELLFESTGVSLQDITGLALSIGPGSFTGLRIGLSTVKGLAYGWQIPVVGVSTLFAHAARVTDYEGLICVLLDARKNEVYAAVFRKTADIVNRVTEDAVASAANVVEMVRGLQSSPLPVRRRRCRRLQTFVPGIAGVCLPETTNYPGRLPRLRAPRRGSFSVQRVDDLGALIPLMFVRRKPSSRGSSLLSISPR